MYREYILHIMNRTGRRVHDRRRPTKNIIIISLDHLPNLT